MKTSFRFPSPLVRGLIHERPNRFVFHVEQRNGEKTRCYCPVTGDIGYLSFEKPYVPCLMSKNVSKNAKTSHTVEAISLDPPDTPDEAIRWIGINQNRANRYAEHFLLNGGLFGINPDDEKMELTREVTLEREKSRGKKETKTKLDFRFEMGDNRVPNYIEVKSPMHSFDSSKHPLFCVERKARTSRIGNRLIRHMDSLTDLAKANAHVGGRCFILLLFMFEANPFAPPKLANGSPILKAVEEAKDAGVEQWQLNLEISPEEVSFLRHFPL